MTLDILEQALIDFLGPRVVPALTGIGVVEPSTSGETPALAFSYEDVLMGGSGLGRQATGTVSGALGAAAQIDLANPRLTFNDESVQLLSSDRRVLTVPHGPLVTSEGAATALGSGDFQASVNAAALLFVSGPPAAGQFSVDPAAGTARFGTALPATGTLTLHYFLGRWDIETTRFGGKLGVHIFGQSSPQVRELTTSLLSLLRPGNVVGLRQLSPVGMTTIRALPDASPAFQKRVLLFDFMFEHAVPKLPTGGGLITSIEIESNLFGSDEIEETIVR